MTKLDTSSFSERVVLHVVAAAGLHVASKLYILSPHYTPCGNLFRIPARTRVVITGALLYTRLTSQLLPFNSRAYFRLLKITLSYPTRPLVQVTATATVELLQYCLVQLAVSSLFSCNC